MMFGKMKGIVILRLGVKKWKIIWSIYGVKIKGVGREEWKNYFDGIWLVLWNY